jgi:hypothetical protein
MDILFMRVDPFIFKTAEFCKRNFNKVRSTLNHIIYEIRKVKLGFRNMKKDVGFAVGFS